MIHGWGELHLAIRAIVQTAGLQMFTLHVQAVELHPGRVDVKWSILVPRVRAEGSDETTPRDLYFSSREPELLLEWLKTRLPPLGAPVAVDELGIVPRSEFPENEEL